MACLRSLPVLFAAFLAASLGACSGGNSSQQTTLSVDGSTALQPLVAQASADYTAKHPEVKIDVNGGGSAKGIFDVSAHSVDIGDSDVDAGVGDLTDHQVAVVAFAVVVGPNTGVTSLRKDKSRRSFQRRSRTGNSSAVTIKRSCS